MLRDPVERAYSAYKHELARGFETERSSSALDLEDERLAGQVDRMLADRDYQSFSHRHHAYVRRGQYAEQLDELGRHFPAEQIHVIESESFFERPETTYAGVLDFLGLPQVLPGRFDRWNGRPSSPMADETRARLREHFQRHDRVAGRAAGTGARMADPDHSPRGCPCGPTTRGSCVGTRADRRARCVVGLLAGFAWSLQQPSTYSATTSVALTPVPKYVTPSTTELVPPEVTIDTDAQLLRQPAGAGRDRRTRSGTDPGRRPASDCP